MEKPTRNLHPERVRPSVNREVHLGGKAWTGYNFSMEHGPRVETEAQATQRHLEATFLQGAQRKTDKPAEFTIDANGVTHPLQREHDDVNKLAEAMGLSDEEEGKADA